MRPFLFALLFLAIAPSLGAQLTLSLPDNSTKTLPLDTLRQLGAMERRDFKVVSHGGEVRKQYETIKGVLLRDVLAWASPGLADISKDKFAICILAQAKDGYRVAYSWNEVFNSPAGDGILVAFEADGKPLSSDGPLAMVTLGDKLSGPRYVKWLSRIAVINPSK